VKSGGIGYDGGVRAFLFALAIALGIPTVALAAFPERADRIVAYTIDVRLDPDAHTLSGRERLVWRNPSNDAVAELWFHLYLNAFRDDRSTFYGESGGVLRDIEMDRNGWGSIDLTTLSVVGGPDLLAHATFEAPDDGNRGDRTVLRVPLPAPVPPGATITIDAAFVARLPRVFARTGYADDYHLVGQWFPKIAVYEPAGTRGRTTGGWNCHQFHANSEFYADYGSFDVSITVPERFIVGATGVRVSTARRRDRTVTHRYRQEDVHDFAWTASPHYVEVNANFSAAADVTAQEYETAARLVDRPVEEMRLSDVKIKLLLQPTHLSQSDRYLVAARTAIKSFGLWYGRYPYQTLTIVDPPFGGLGSGGMEYPTFVTAGTLRILDIWPLKTVRFPEEVLVHEFAHQFWYGLVGSNEFEEPWLDEGVTSYSTARLMDRMFGADESFATIAGLKVSHLDFDRLGNRPDRVSDRIRQPAWTFLDGAYDFYSYSKPALALATLERVLGDQTMARVMRTYAERWRFRHPSSDDFYAVANEVSRRDLSWFFRQVFEGTDAIDYAVTSIRSRAAGSNFETRVLVRRLGGVIVPQSLKLTFDDGRSETVNWDGSERWKRIVVVRPAALRRAELDPEHRIVLDADWVNNARRRVPEARVATTWAARLSFWLQQIVSVVGF
jgi:Peptidase family M1 domain